MLPTDPRVGPGVGSGIGPLVGPGEGRSRVRDITSRVDPRGTSDRSRGGFRVRLGSK